jgi:hypothetical protein
LETLLTSVVAMLLNGFGGNALSSRYREIQHFI